jgi:hypothetical protein
MLKEVLILLRTIPTIVVGVGVVGHLIVDIIITIIIPQT